MPGARNTISLSWMVGTQLLQPSLLTPRICTSHPELQGEPSPFLQQEMQGSKLLLLIPNPWKWFVHVPKGLFSASVSISFRTVAIIGNDLICLSLSFLKNEIIFSFMLLQQQARRLEQSEHLVNIVVKLQAEVGGDFRILRCYRLIHG